MGLRARAVAFFLALAGCGPDPHVALPDAAAPPDARPPAQPVSIEVTPGDVVLEYTLGGIPVAQAFTAAVRWSDGSTVDVTDEATWTAADPAIVDLAGTTAVATGEKAGSTTITATWGTLSGTATLGVRVRSIHVVDSAAAGAPDAFTVATEDPARAPTIVYPADQALVPPNLGGIEIHWTQPAGNDRIEVSVTSEFLEVRAYYAGTLSATNGWRVLEPEDHALVVASLRGQPYEVRVRAMSSASPGTAGTSAPVAGRVAAEEVRGGLYYYEYTGGGRVVRYDLATPELPAEPFYTPAEAGGACVGCHAVSRDGSRLFVRLGPSTGVGLFTVIDVATRMPLFPAAPELTAHLAAFSPDGSQLLTSGGGDLVLRDAATGAAIETAAIPGRVSHPAWSPTGDRIAYTLSETSNDTVSQGGVVVQDLDPVTGALGLSRLIAWSPPENDYYPCFSPDGEWVIFNHAVSGTSNGNDNAELYVARADGSSAPMLLATAGVGPGTGSYPRFAPFAQTVGGADGDEPVIWFTFTSRRAFGVRLASGARNQLWIAPFFPARAAAGLEASAPALRLPFQTITVDSLLAEMTEEIL